MILLRKWLRRIIRVIVVIGLTLFVIRIYDTQKGSQLELWHKFIPHELTARQINQLDWQGYLQAEQQIFAEVKQQVTDKLVVGDNKLLNRYYVNSPIYHEHFKQNWNRSFLLLPVNKPKGAVVLLHGLTDSPYSLRHIALHYQQKGFVAVGIRMPAHGTVPAALTKVHWEDWLAATHLAVKEAKKQITSDQPLHIVGYSNGGALAVMYALEAIDNPALAKPDQLVLISPMIGVTSFARFAGLAALPAIFPPFAKASWVDVIPEYNPFKYNSFPVSGARQSYELTSALQERINYAQTQHKLKQLPPLLTFLSVVDSTVSASSVISALYNKLPVNNNALVLFDVNKTATFNPLLKINAYNAVNQLLPNPPRTYQTIVIGTASPTNNQAIAYITDENQTDERRTELGLAYPIDIYSLSHIALPFPQTDSLYGQTPLQPNEFGVSFGSLAIRGERGVLVTSLDNLLRVSANPFFPYLLQKIDQRIEDSLQK